VFQCLLIRGENTGEDALRNAKEFVTSDEEFQSFISRHGNIGCLVPESNEKVCAVFYVSVTAAKCSIVLTYSALIICHDPRGLLISGVLGGGTY
jgi:hypothetical protein